MNDLLTAIATLVAVFCIAFFVGRGTAKRGVETAFVERVDTLVVRDTIKVTEAVSVTKRVVDSVLVPIHDTTKIRDTLYVYLVREQIRWEDSLAVVYASGVKPQVDSVIHFTQERIITKEIPVIQVKRTRWGIGVQAGVTGNKTGVTPYVGVGVSYNILSW